MSARLCPRLEPTDDWQQLQLLSQFPEQLTYELIRPVVLFGHSPAERAQQTGAAARTLYRQAARFAKEGMAQPLRAAGRETSPTTGRSSRRLSSPQSRASRPSILHEITTICGRASATVPARTPSSGSWPRTRLPPVLHVATRPTIGSPTPAKARLAIIRLHSEGWNKKSIAAYLSCQTPTATRSMRRSCAGSPKGSRDWTTNRRHHTRRRARRT